MIAFSIGLVHLGCTHVKREFNRSLTKSEVAEPPGNYQAGVNMRLAGQVQFSAPRKKPVIEKTVEIDMQNSRDVMVDSKGGVWFQSGSEGSSNPLFPIAFSTLTRLNPDGTGSWGKKLKSAYYIYPALSCEGAVICWEHFMVGLGKGKVQLECVDLDGKTLWNTGSINMVYGELARLSNDRFICNSYDNNNFNFSIYSLTDGKLLGTLDFPELYRCADVGFRAPVEIPDSGWISFGEIPFEDDQSKEHSEYESHFKKICRYSNQMEEIWKIDTESKYLLTHPILTNDDALIFGGERFLAKINLSDGNIIWKNTDGCNFQPCGITTNKEIVLVYRDKSNESFLKVIDQNGNDAWKGKYPCSRKFAEAVIIYKDNTVLFGHKEGLTLIDKKGKIWEISTKELNLNPDDIFLNYWNLFPAPDNRIIASIKLSMKNSKIYFIKSPH